MSELLLGCGFARDRRLDPATGAMGAEAATIPWRELATLDENLETAPDFLSNMDEAGSWFVKPQTTHARRICGNGGRRLPDGYFDEVHAYEVLEHLGYLGQVPSFFGTFNEIYRLLKLGGALCATVPDYRSPWAFGDPGHRRLITLGSLEFLSDDQDHTKPPSSDYRRYRHCNFKLKAYSVINGSLYFILVKRPRGSTAVRA